MRLRSSLIVIALVVALPVFAEEAKSDIPDHLKKVADELGCVSKVACKTAFDANFEKSIQIAERNGVYDKDTEKKELLKTYKKEVIEKLQSVSEEDLDEKIIELARTIAKKNPKLAGKLGVEERTIASAESRLDEERRFDMLEEDLRNGKYSEVGRSPDEAGAYCLRPESPQVCDEIARKYFGDNGLEELARARKQIRDVEEYYKGGLESLELSIPGRPILRGKAAIMSECDRAFGSYDIEVARACGEFGVKNGFASRDDVEEGLQLLEETAKNKQKGVRIDKCVENPESCKEFLPEQARSKFDVVKEMERIMRDAMGFDPRTCKYGLTNSEVGEKCLEGSKKALPLLGGLVSKTGSVQARKILEEIKLRIADGDEAMKFKKEAEETLGLQGGPGGCKSEQACFDYCSVSENGPECIAFGAKSGMFKADDAMKRLRGYNQNINRRYSDEESSDMEEESLDGERDINFGRTMRGNETSRTSDAKKRVGSVVRPEDIMGDINDRKYEDRQSERRDDYALPGTGPRPECFQAIQAGDFVKAKEACASISSNVRELPSVKSDTTPIIGDRIRGREKSIVCPDAVPKPDLCKDIPNSIPEQDPSTCKLVCKPITLDEGRTKATCPALPTVESCPRGQVKVVTYSSSECGAYYGCAPQSIIDTSNLTPSYLVGGKKYYTPGEALRACEDLGRTQTEQGMSSEDKKTCAQLGGYIGPIGDDSNYSGQCSKYGSGWHSMEGETGNCYGPGMQDFYTGNGTYYLCKDKPADVRAPSCTLPGDSSRDTGARWNANNDWTQTTWRFSDGSTENSYILNRTDAEYQNYLAPIRAQCLTISRSRFSWRSGAGSDSADNWRNFGIPDCSGSGSGNASTTDGRTGDRGNSRWREKVWYFNDGSERSFILLRTDSEYSSYVDSIETQCRTKSRSQFSWKSGAGDDSAGNWRNFGMPDCSGNAGNVTDGGTETGARGNSNWTQTTWRFSDGSTENSYILNRTDAEYQNYLAPIRAQCLTIPRNRFSWRTGAGSDSADNWRSFGIPDCSGSGSNTSTGSTGASLTEPYTFTSTGFVARTHAEVGTYCGQEAPGTGSPGNNPRYDAARAECNRLGIPWGGSNTSTYYGTSNSTDGECQRLSTLLPGCHSMPSTQNARFDGNMTRYVLTGSSDVKSCTDAPISGCSGSGSTGTYPAGSESVGSPTQEPQYVPPQYIPPPSTTPNYQYPQTGSYVPPTGTYSPPSPDGSYVPPTGTYTLPPASTYTAPAPGTTNTYTPPPPPPPTSLRNIGDGLPANIGILLKPFLKILGR